MVKELPPGRMPFSHSLGQNRVTKVTIRIITVVRWVTPRGAGSNPVRDMVYQTLLSIRQSDRRKRTTSLCLLPQFTTTPQASHSFSFPWLGTFHQGGFPPFLSIVLLCLTSLPIT